MDKSTIQQYYFSIMGTNIDSKTLSYWYNVINSGQKQLSDLANELAASADYKTRLQNMFKEMYLDTVCLEYSDDLFQHFITKNGYRIYEEKDIRTYIIQLPQFIDKCSNAISSTYEMHTNNKCTAQTINRYLEKFIEDTTYTMEHMITDVLSSSNGSDGSEQGGASDLSSTANNNEASSGGSNTMSDKSLLEQYFINKVGFTPTADYLDGLFSYQHLKLEPLKKFEKTFERPMFVHEYFKYIVKDNIDDFEAVKATYQTNLETMKNVFEEYTMSELDEYTFVSKYLSDIEIDGFLDSFIKEILNSSAYEVNMKNVINSLYKDLFDETLDVQDIEYAFLIAKNKALSVKSPLLQVELSSLKDATDEMISHIFKQFIDVLNRNPDINEIREYVDVYRENAHQQTLEMLDVQVQRRLINSLEFHDIVKNRIKTLFSINKNRDIMPSEMYNILNKVIGNIQNLTVDNLDVMIIETCDDL